MTKKEKIQEAYGEYWKDYGHLTDEDGFIYQSDLFYPDTEMKKDGIEIQIKSVEEYRKWSNIKWRPISLSGIEDNNGWVKIENEEQYNELENGQYEWWNINTGRYDKGDLWEYGCFTHYKVVIIEKPKPPIY